MIKQIIKFGIVGALGAITNLLVVVLLVEFLHWHPLTANIVGFLIAFNVSFWGHRYVTFTRTSRRLHQALPRFFFTSGTGFLLNESLFYLLLKYTVLPYFVSLFFILAVVACYTFLLGKFWAFKEHPL